MLAKEVFINPAEIELDDGNKKDAEGILYGGISYIGECLDNFLGEVELDFNTITVPELLKAMNECNIVFKDAKKAMRW